MNKDLLVELIKDDECKWIEYKENWFDRERLGQYISAMSNAAAFRGEESTYFIWGIKEGTKEIVGTDFQYDVDVKNEPLKHYLARESLCYERDSKGDDCYGRAILAQDSLAAAARFQAILPREKPKIHEIRKSVEFYTFREFTIAQKGAMQDNQIRKSVEFYRKGDL